MEGTSINELSVHYLDGEFYHDTRKYLEKHGCIWTEQREAGQLQSVHLQFPSGTLRVSMPPNGDYERYRVTFTAGGLLFWSVHRTTKCNVVSIPYVYL